MSGWATPWLWLGAQVFRAGVALRGAAYDQGWLRVERSPVPVISVGNLRVGGAGKTPFVRLLVERIAGRARVAILSRGYGGLHSRRGGPPLVVSRGEGPLASAQLAGDEPVLLAELTSAAVVVSADRAAAARLAVAELGAELLLLDDGFQHRRLARQLDIVLLDARQPFDTGRLLPLGRLREPPSALARAQLLALIHGPGEEPPPAALLPGAAQALPRLEVVVEARPLRPLRGERVALIAGIARPERFRATVESLGAEVVLERYYPDHAPLARAGLEDFLRAAQGAGATRALTTEKDRVRWPLAPEDRLEALPIAHRLVSGEAALDAALTPLLVRRTG